MQIGSAPELVGEQIRTNILGELNQTNCVQKKLCLWPGQFRVGPLTTGLHYTPLVHVSEAPPSSRHSSEAGCSVSSYKHYSILMMIRLILKPAVSLLPFRRSPAVAVRLYHADNVATLGSQHDEQSPVYQVGLFSLSFS